jgi:Family of unknown function (DUF6188)
MTRSSDTSLFGDKELDAVGEVENHVDGSSFSVRFDPYNRSDPIRENLTELAAIIGRTDVHAKAYVTGTLEIVLNDGTVLTVASKDEYEAWTYTFGKFILSCPPGGFDPLPL